MKIRFLADADLRQTIVRGLKRREPIIDFLPQLGVIAEGLEDPLVLKLAAELNRVLVSHDFETMPGHFYRFIATTPSPGLILIPQARTTAEAIDELSLLWACMEPAEFRNRIHYL